MYLKFPMMLVRSTTPADFDALLAMKSDPEDIKWSGFATSPDAARFRKWFDQAIIDPNRVMFSGILDDRMVGYVHFRRVGPTSFEISTGIVPTHRGRGLAGQFRREAIHCFRQLHPNAALEMWIAEGNIASQRCWAKAGYVSSSIQRAREFPYPTRRIETMRLWLFNAPEEER